MADTVKKYVGYSVILLGEFLAIYFLFSNFVRIAFSICSACRMQVNIRMEDFFIYFFYFSVGYTIFSFFINCRTASRIKQHYYPWLVLLTITDIVLIPVCMMLILSVYRMRGQLEIVETELYNLLVLLLLVCLKHVIILAAQRFYWRSKTSK